MQDLDFYSERFTKAKKIADDLTDYLNNFQYRENSAYFNKAMTMQHRTLQQNFTRLVLGWLEFCSTDEFRTDPRNEDSKRIATDLIEQFNKFIKDKYHIDDPEPPSRWLGTI